MKFSGASVEIRQLLNEVIAEDPSLTIVKRSNGHWQVSRNGEGEGVIVPSTPSDVRSVMNSRASLRRVLGLKLREKKPLVRSPRVRRGRVESSLLFFGPQGATAWQIAERIWPTLAELENHSEGADEVHAIRGALRTLVNKHKAYPVSKERRDGHKMSMVYVHSDFSVEAKVTPAEEPEAQQEPVQETSAEQPSVNYGPTIDAQHLGTANIVPNSQAHVIKPVERTHADDLKDAVDYLLSQPLSVLEDPGCVEQISRLAPYLRMMHAFQQTK